MSKTTVYFQVREAYAMFPGGASSESIGGAGAVEYYLADALSYDPRLRVVWVFPSDVDVSALSHPRIEIRRSPQPVSRGLPLLSRRTNRERLLQPFLDDGPRVLFGPPFMARSSHQWHLAAESGARAVIRIANDTEVVNTKMKGIQEFLRKQFTQGNERRPHVVVHSQWQQDRFIEMVGEQARDYTHLINKGWDSPAVRPGWEGRRHLLWVGSCRVQKQPWSLLTLARMVPDQDFLMVVPPYLGKRDELYNTIVREAATIPNVTIIGKQIPIEEVDALFRQAKAYVNTSEWEGFANTFLQAGAAGTPVVSLIVDPDGYINRYGVGLSAGGSLRDLAAGINALLSDGERAAADAGRASWQYVRENHSMDCAVQQFGDLILRAGRGE